MCGITGLVDYRSASADGDRVRGMTAALVHRGPDYSAVRTYGPATLGHARLSIIDLSPLGRQPMETPDGRYVLTFNGEIYNFQEIKAELSARGHRFV